MSETKCKPCKEIITAVDKFDQLFLKDEHDSVYPVHHPCHGALALKLIERIEKLEENDKYLRDLVGTLNYDIKVLEGKLESKYEG